MADARESRVQRRAKTKSVAEVYFTIVRKRVTGGEGGGGG